MFNSSLWIWSDKQHQNQRVHFFFDKYISELPPKAIVHIGSETKYWLFVNGALAVFDGGLFRESSVGNGYFDTVDITDHLKVGHNEITVSVWYYGNGGRNNTYCEKGGLIFACKELEIYSSTETLCYADNAYYQTETEAPSYLYGGDNTAYDARRAPFSLCPTRNRAEKATVVGKYGDAPFGELLPRSVPLLFFTERIPSQYSVCNDKLTVKLPYAMQFSPYIKLSAAGNERIDVRSDRYEVHGGPGDTHNIYRGHRAEYICREGVQEFEMLDWIFGEECIFTVPKSITVLEVGYRESGYNSKITATFECDDPRVNRLFEKSSRTLAVCMRENYMDCPDRERGQWIGDVSVQAPQIAYLLDGNGLLLLRKAINDFITLRKGDRLVGNVPGDNYSELPSQSLNSISELGMIAVYYSITRDTDIIRLAFEPSVRYLMLWETDNQEVVLPRKGNWEWYDHLYNCDNEILNVTWYYSALRFAKRTSSILNDNRFDKFITQRMKAIETHFDQRYWNGKLGCYKSGNAVDDRANAMAVLSGLCPQERYPQVRYVLLSVFNSSTYMENYVLQALCEMGYTEDAFRRMMSRYQPLIDNENSTLWEDFYHLGTKNHAWSGAPATVLMRYFAGVQTDLTLKKTQISPLKYIRCSYTDRNEQLINLELKDEK